MKGTIAAATRTTTPKKTEEGTTETADRDKGREPITTSQRTAMTNRNSLSNPINRRTSPKRNLRLSACLASCIIGFLFFSCDRPAIYDQYQAIQGTTWEKEKAYYFTFQIEDISIPYDISLEIRNNNLYPYQNLWIFYQMEFPIGPLRKDTMECMLADDYGKWYGHGISLFQSSFPIRTQYRFPFKGQYTFSLRQGMRNDQLPGIQEIGLRISPSSDTH